MEDRLEEILAAIQKEQPIDTPKDLEALKATLSQKHAELIEALKTEEKIFQELHRKPL
jgi:hypothetical protein